MGPDEAGAHTIHDEDEGMVPARIAAISQETPTVKRFTLSPQGQLEFLPGQWVDFAVPGITAVGGYSFTSTPRQLRQHGTFELAVRRSAHPVAKWLHDEALPGDEVAVRVGGTFTYQPGDERRPLLLLAGGIGINPLLSILQHFCELAGYGGSSNDSSSAAEAKLRPPHAVVLYSASVPAELAFRAELERLCSWASGRMRLQLLVTAPEWKGREAEWGGRWGRIGTADLRHALRWLERGNEEAEAAGSAPAGQEDDSSSSSSSSGGSPPAVPPDLAVLLCGPAAMEDQLIAELRALGVPQQQIRFERWW